MRIVNQLDVEKWYSFVNEHPQGNIFHTPEMFRVFAAAKNHRPSLWATIDEAGQVLALLLPIEISLINGLLRRFTTRSVAYGSVLVAPGHAGQQALVALLQAYTQQMSHPTLFTELRHLSDTTAVQPILNQYGFVYEDHLNFLVDLDRPVGDMMQAVGTRTRKRLRHGLRAQDVSINEISEANQLPIWYELLQKTYRAARVPLADRSLFEVAFEILYPRGMVKFWLATVGEASVAASAELLYKDVVYGWYGGVDRVFSHYNPNELLTWHILRWSAENGYKVYDFGGAGKPDEDYGVRDFKAKFGGQLVNFGRNVHIRHSATLKLSKRVYQLYRRFL
jgi:hypothetical protein